MAPKKPAKPVPAKGKMTTRASPRKPSPSAKKLAGPTSKITKSSPAKKKTGRAAVTKKSPIKPATKAATAQTKSTTPRIPKTKKIMNVSHKSVPSISGERLFKDGAESEISFNSRQALEDIINEIGKRSLTNVDKDLIQAIQDLERGRPRGYEDLEDSLSQREKDDYAKGKPFNCHSKLYRKFETCMDGLCIPATKTNSSRAVKGASRRNVVPSIEVPAESSPKRASTASRRSISRSPAKSASPAKTAASRGKSMSPIKASAASRRTASKSPRKNATRGKSMSPVKPSTRSENAVSSSSAKAVTRGKSASPTKPGADTGRAVSKSPSKTASRGNSMSPIKTSAAARRSTSRSPAKSTRGKSASPTKATTMTRPLRTSRSASPKKPASSAKKVTKAVSAARFRAKDDYGAIMRRVENEAYILLTSGKGERYEEARVEDEARQELDFEDDDYATERGYERARTESSLHEFGNQDEQDLYAHMPDYPIDEVDETGVVLNQRTVGRPRESASPTKRSPVKNTRADWSPASAPWSPMKITRATASPSPNKRSPAKTSPTKASSVGSVISLRRSPSKASASKISDMTPLPPNMPSKEGHGHIRSAANPEFLQLRQGKSKKNNFFVTMPMKPRWHRNMPSFFSYGETPYMEKYVSDQIEHDLSRSHDEKEQPAQTRWWKLPSFLTGASKATTPAPYSPTKSMADAVEDRILTMWDLPELSAEEEETVRRGSQAAQAAPARGGYRSIYEEY